jgi:hypothetical protein
MAKRGKYRRCMGYNTKTQVRCKNRLKAPKSQLTVYCNGCRRTRPISSKKISEIIVKNQRKE